MTRPIEFDSAFMLDEISASNPDAPAPVHEHVSSLQTLVQTNVDAGTIDGASASFLREFANRHDAGYGTDVSLLETEPAQAVLGRAMEELDTGVDPREIAEYLGGHRDKYLVARVIGHGVLGLAENTLAYRERGMGFDWAFGLASAMTAHHPGYPITMVSGFLPDEARLTERQRAAFFVDNNGSDPEEMRGKLITMAAEHLHVSVEAAGRAAIMGFALDRITPGSVPTEIQVKPDGNTVTKGGELLQKKFGLVVGDIVRDNLTDEMSIAALYRRTIKALQAEAQAAIEAAEFAGQQDIQAFIQRQAVTVIGQAEQSQNEALAALYELGLGGEFTQLSTERERVVAAALSKSDNPAPRYLLASYNAALAILTS